MVGKDCYGFGKLHQELSYACAYWNSFTGTPFFSSTYVHFNAFWFQEECASIIFSASLIFIRHMFSIFLTQTALSLLRKWEAAL